MGDLGVSTRRRWPFCRPVCLFWRLSAQSHKGATSGESGGTPATAVVGYPILRGDGIGNARFGQTETIAIGELEAVLGKPLNSTPTNPSGDCAIQLQMQWPILTAFFSQGRFVGYGTYSVTGHLLKSNASTAAGLRIGESLIQARVLIGDRSERHTHRGAVGS